ncbi:MAG TPA: hypothetical protein V6D29_25005, partial [Leptolyngbyaceae cyanobacterium]
RCQAKGREIARGSWTNQDKAFALGAFILGSLPPFLTLQFSFKKNLTVNPKKLLIYLRLTRWGVAKW